MSGNIHRDSWRYQRVKRWRQRAATFRDEADTPEKREAWTIVIGWFDDLLNGPGRYMSKKGVIRLKDPLEAKDL